MFVHGSMVLLPIILFSFSGRHGHWSHCSLSWGAQATGPIVLSWGALAFIGPVVLLHRELWHLAHHPLLRCRKSYRNVEQ